MPLRRPKRSLNTHPQEAWGGGWRCSGGSVTSKMAKTGLKWGICMAKMAKTGQKWAFTKTICLIWATMGTVLRQKWYKMSQNYQPQQTCGLSMLVSWFWGVCAAVFGTLWSHNTAKSGQNGPIWTIKGFPKAPSAAVDAGKVHFWHKNALCQPVSQTIFFECRVGGWLSIVGLRRLHGWVHRFATNSAGVVMY